MPKDHTKKVDWKQTFHLLKEYFNSDEKHSARLNLVGVILSVAALVALLMVFSWWSVGFWAAISAKASSAFLTSMLQFTGLVIAYVGTEILKSYLIGKLSNSWRNWLMNKLSDDLFKNKNYLIIKRSPSENTSDLDQRIQEDSNNVITQTLHLGTGFINSVLSLVAFVGTLWIVGGTLSFTLFGLPIIIPGYLVWVSLISAAAATGITRIIAKSLSQTIKKLEHAEADLRQEINTVDQHAENIAEEHATQYHESSIKNAIKRIYTISKEKLFSQTKLFAFQSFYKQIAEVLPYIASAPLYFANLIGLGELMQIGSAFYTVSKCLSWYVESYEDLAGYQASLERISELQQSFKDNELIANGPTIAQEQNQENKLIIQHLDILRTHVENKPPIMRDLNISLTAGEHILIKGPSGLGKSTLFKAISASWSNGNGTISIPTGNRLCFLPQTPTILPNSLKAVLAYPDDESTYTHEEYTKALQQVGSMDEFISRLDEVHAWAHSLSGGQQQRISFARVILKKPDWVFLDEATSALDEESEAHVYNQMRALKKTTIVSIAHRNTVEKYHSKILLFKPLSCRKVEVEEQASARAATLH